MKIKVSKSKVYKNKFDVLIDKSLIKDLTYEDAISYINFEVSVKFNSLTISKINKIIIKL